MPTQADISDATKRSEYSQDSQLDERLQSFATSMAGTYEPKFADGTTSQYLRGDKTWQVIQQSDVSGLVAALASKAALAHIHAINDITGLSAALSGLSDAAAAKVAMRLQRTKSRSPLATTRNRITPGTAPRSTTAPRSSSRQAC